MPEHRSKREIRMPSKYRVEIRYIGSDVLACCGISESVLPLSDCGKYFIVSGTDESEASLTVSFPVSPDVYVFAERM